MNHFQQGYHPLSHDIKVPAVGMGSQVLIKRDEQKLLLAASLTGCFLSICCSVYLSATGYLCFYLALLYTNKLTHLKKKTHSYQKHPPDYREHTHTHLNIQTLAQIK